MKHVACVSRKPAPAAIGPGLTILQQVILFLSKGKIFLPPIRLI